MKLELVWTGRDLAGSSRREKEPGNPRRNNPEGKETSEGGRQQGWYEGELLY